MPKIKLPVSSADGSKQPADEADQEIKIKKAKSSLSEFVKRALPSEEEVEQFEEYAQAEAKESEIENGLSEIYHDDDGKMVDVKTMDIKKGRGLVYKFFAFLFTLALLTGLAWLGYYYFFLRSGDDSSSVSLAISGEPAVEAGKEFYYTVTYKNQDQVEIKDIGLKLTYPENFVFLDASPAAGEKNDSWQISGLAPHRSAEIKIKGKLIGPADASSVILGEMNYTPANFSSQFKKEASFENKISEVGIDFSFDNASAALVGATEEITVKYKARENNYLNAFRLTVEPLPNLEFIKDNATATPGVWQISELTPEEKEIRVKFKFKEKTADSQEIKLNFEYSDDGQKYYSFLEKIITLEVMKRDLNLTLIVNGSRTDQGVDFGQTLNYSIVYANKGQTEMKDIVIMAVLESDFLDWKSLDDKNNGLVKNNTVSWSKAEVPNLASLPANAEGTLDFSLKVAARGEIDLSKDYQIKSYAQFSVGQVSADAAGEDSRSNTIVNKINSDLDLKEQVRYFDDDNIAVGSGPQPPKVGESTSYKVYWTLSNNLNELNNLRIEAALPANVSWNNKSRAGLGNLSYDAVANKIIWEIGRLPITVYKADAEFNISVTPTPADQNKIIVLLQGTTVQATDSVTNAPLNKKLKAKTTKLEDDPVVTDDGRVVE